MPDANAAERGQAGHDDVIYPDAIPFVLVHLACLAALWTGVTAEAVALGLGLYVLRMFGVTAGYHRYFSHRSFKTGRAFQLVLALVAQSSSQRGVLWWAAKHRWHHRHSDTELDVHSPARSGFFRAHVGWIFTARHEATEMDAVPDLAKYPELVWLDRHYYLPPVALAVLCWLVAGWPGLVVGFCWSTVATWHGTFCINSLAHVVGRRRYVTGDDSRNNWLLAIVTLGEGWHNNHHAYQSSARQGFRWWEYDPTYYALRALSWVGLVRDLQEPPEAVLRGEQRLGRKVIEKVSLQLAVSFPTDRLAAEIREAWARTPVWAELQRRARTTRDHAHAYLAEMRMPGVPGPEEIRRLAQARLARTPSLDEIVARTHEILRERISRRLVEQAAEVAA
jgi:stearoyl-CoA desaturase (delta-9 desaturase)